MIWSNGNPITLAVMTYLGLTIVGSLLCVRAYDVPRGRWRRHPTTGALPARWRRRLDTALAVQLPARIVGWLYLGVGDAAAALSGQGASHALIAVFDVVIALMLWWEWRTRRKHRRPRAHRAAAVVVDVGHRLEVQPR